MSTNVGQTQWNPLDEREIENPKTRIADEAFEEKGEKYSNPEIAEAERLAALKAMGMKPFVAPNKKGEKSPESAEALKEQADILKNPLTPFLERLLHDEVIGPEAYNELTSQLTKNPDYKTVIENSENINPEKKQIIIDGLDGLNNPEMAEKNKQDFTRDFAEDLEIFKDGERTEEATDMVGAAYILGPNGVDNPMEQSESLDMAFKTALNRALDGRVDLPVNNETFQKNLDLVRNIGAENGTIEFNIRFTALSDILTTIHNTDGTKAKAIGKKEKQMKARSIAEIEDRIQKLQYDIDRAKNENDDERVKKLTAEQDIVKNELDNMSKGEVFAAGEIDISSEGRQEQQSEAA